MYSVDNMHAGKGFDAGFNVYSVWVNYHKLC